MLQTKDTLKSGDVYTFKLTTGEEVVARYVSNNDKYFMVEKPLALGVQQTEKGPQLGFMPFAMTLNDTKKQEIPINIAVVITYFEPSKEVSDGYIQQTSGIQIASAGSI